MNKKETNDFFDALLNKIESMTREDFLEIERRKPDFFSNLKNLESGEENFRLLEIEALFEPEFFPSEYQSVKSIFDQLILDASYTDEELYLAA